MWQLSDSWPNQFQNNLNLTWPSNTAGISLDSRLEYSKITHRYAKVSLFTWFLCWKLPIDTDFIHFICHFHQAVTEMPENVLMGQLHLSKACWELWLSDDQPHSDYNGQWQMALCKFSTKPTEEWKKLGKCMLSNKLRSVQNTGTCYPGLGWICQVHLGFGLSASAQVPDKPALAWVACPGILHRS